MDPHLSLTLDDFIPPHLQKKQNRGASPTYNAPTDSADEGDLFYKATLILTDDSQDSPSPQIERRWIRYEGIGPIDEDGMPFASRSSVDKPREWYKNMYRVLHQMSDSEDSDGDDNLSKPDHHEDSFILSNKSKFVEDENNGWTDMVDRSKQRSQDPSHLHITVKSNIRESPSKSSSTLKIETPPDVSKPHATTLPHSSFRQPSQTSPYYSSKASHFINKSTTTNSSQNYNTQQSQQVSSTSSKYQTSEPGPRHVFSDHFSHSSQNYKETTSLQSLKQKSKYSSPARTASGTRILSPTSKEPRRSTSKMLEQLETDLRNFTEELDKDLDMRKQRSEATLELCEEVILRRNSYQAGGSTEPAVNKSRRRYTEEQQDLSPVSKAVVKFDFVAESEKEISLQRGTTVNILKKIDEHWLLGEQDGRRGLFPESYVRVLSPGQQEPLDTPQLSGVALYDFKADSDAELPLRKVSSALTLKERPCTVQAPASNRLQELQGTLYRVLFNYSPKNTDELQLNSGDIVTVTQHCDDGWYVGVCWRTQKFGTFPGNYVAPYETS